MGTNTILDKQMDKPTSASPFDDVFRTETVRMKEWFIPLLNEIYGTKYALNSEVVFYENEQLQLAAAHSDDLESAGIPRKITDRIFSVNGDLYHMECQANEDGSIVFRVAEYDSHIAVRLAEYDSKKDVLSVHLPYSSIVYLRRTEKTQPSQIVYHYGKQQLRIEIPAISAQMYSLDDIFEKQLYVLIPFYFLRYESYFKHGIGLQNPQIQRDMEQLNARLLELHISEKLSDHNLRDLIEMTQIVLKQITRKLPQQERERLVKGMGGQVLEMEWEKEWKAKTERAIEEGMQKGMQKGMQEGMQKGMQEGMQKGIEEGRRVGRQEDILKVIRVLRDSLKPEEIIDQIKKFFDLTDDESMKYMKMSE